MMKFIGNMLKKKDNAGNADYAAMFKGIIDQAIQGINGDMHLYNAKRLEANTILIQYLLGCNLKKNSGGQWKAVNFKQVDNSMVMLLANELRRLVSYEERMAVTDVSAIPAPDIMVLVPSNGKIDSKTLLKIIFEGENSLINRNISANDFPAIMALGDAMRGHIKRRNLVIAGIAITLVATGLAVAAIHYNKQKQNSKLPESCDDTAIMDILDDGDDYDDYDDVDIIDAAETPVVDIA